jgi:hypothetical protein
MNVSYIVSFNRAQQVMFDIEIISKGRSISEMIAHIELAAYQCLKVNGFDVDDVWKISTAADWANIPLSYAKVFTGKFIYFDSGLGDALKEVFEGLESFDQCEYAGITYGIEEYYNKSA